ncbi:hypothetical protein NL108_007542 [Boleophthalmus pectinirostris]|nr:hypothetical protein NL108_007542 [Boleophthalmus pectinirostris]
MRLQSERSGHIHPTYTSGSESRERRESEVSEFINIWGDLCIQAKLERSYRDQVFFLNDSQSWLQCQQKIKILRDKYKEAKDSNKRSGRGRVTCTFLPKTGLYFGRQAQCLGDFCKH